MKRKTSIVKQQDRLLFVDTTILLNLYRLPDEVSLSLLKRLSRLQNRLITTFQVEVEFKKNRIGVIKKFFGSLKSPDVMIPAFLNEVKTARDIRRDVEKVKRALRKLNQQIQKILADSSKDPVFRAAQELFNRRGPLNLHDSHADARSITRRAWRRYTAGWPPRKDSDTSMGDAINWEWILKCVRNTGQDVVIVTQDGDYGTAIAGKVYPNDQLVSEIKQIGKARKLLLFNHLAPALKELKVKITKKEESEEEAKVSALSSSYFPNAGPPYSAPSSGVDPDYRYLLTTAWPHADTRILDATNPYANLITDPAATYRNILGQNPSTN
jgi:uncharacterized protein YoxC